MNYRHRFHAGNFADVVKHVLVVLLARALQKKEAGCLFLDTHAGRGIYDLAGAEWGDTRQRQPEHPDGIGRLVGRTDWPEEVREYMELVKASGGGPEKYPGSPMLLRRIARPQDRVALCELHPDEFAALQAGIGRARRVSLHRMDGYRALAAMLPPPERRALVLIDPPYESQDEWGRVDQALADGLRRFPSGVYAIWYPLSGRGVPPLIFESKRRDASSTLLIAELVVAPHSSGLRGCGLAIVNPPWQFEMHAESALRYLSGVLARVPGGGCRLRRITSQEAARAERTRNPRGPEPSSSPRAEEP